MSNKALIDFGAVYWRFWHLSEGEEVSSAARKTLKYVRDLYAQYGVENIVVAVDAPPYKRNELYAGYKANRKPKNEAAVEELKKSFEKILDDGITIAKSQGYEADDVICTLLQKEKYDVYAMDKDLLQCTDIIGPDGKLKTAEGYLGVEKNRVVDYLVLVGDSADNIPGVKGIGAIAAKKMLDTFDNIKGIYDALNENEEQFKKTAQSLREAEAFIDTAYQLIKLEKNCEVEFEKREAKKEEPIMCNPDEVDVEFEEIKDTESDNNKEKESTAIQLKHDQLSFQQSLEPMTLKQAWWTAQTLVQSRLYDKTVEQSFITLMRGRSLGIDVVTAMENIHIIKGKTCMGAALMSALIRSNPVCEYLYVKHSDDNSCTWVTKRKDNPHETSRTYTWEEATRAGETEAYNKKAGRVTTKDNYEKRRSVMLQWRCMAALGRRDYSDLLWGMYAREEME